MGLLGKKIYIFRKKKCGQTQQEFAKIGKTTKTSLFNYEKGINCPSSDFFISLKTHFGDKLNLNWFFDDSIPIEPPTEMMVAESEAQYGYTNEEKEYIHKLIEIFRHKKEDTIAAIQSNIDVCLDTPNAKKNTPKKKK